jgi:monoamine oxidase
MSAGYDVVVIGGGAAGIAATRRLHDAGAGVVLLEARDRLGGRAWTVQTPLGFPIDLGCGWLHSADQNVWRKLAEETGFTIDQTPPPWSRPVLPKGAPTDEQRDFGRAIGAFRGATDEFPEDIPDVPASSFLEPGGKWNAMLGAVSTYYSGAELDRISTRDLARFQDTGVNWRVREGYGTLVASHARGLPARLSCVVTRIDRRGKRLAIETSDGVLDARTVIVTLPTNVIAANEHLFAPALPEKIEAARGLPLGLADKLYLSLDNATEFNEESRAFGNMTRVATAAYHFRPYGRPEIEAYFGGALAAELEAGSPGSFLDFALSELTAIYGADFARRVKPIGEHRWGIDPFARGSYSYALPGHADDRARLAAPVEDRIFFAGEACSRDSYSTAHGAYETGVAAAENALKALAKRAT